MLIVSWWFIALIANCLFYDLIKSADEELTKKLVRSGINCNRCYSDCINV